MRGLDIAPLLEGDSFRNLVSIAFRIERGWANHELGNIEDAAEDFYTAIRLMETSSDQSDQVFRLMRVRLGFLLTWVNSSWRGSKSSDARPYQSMFTKFDKPTDEANLQQTPPYHALRALLANYGAWYLPEARIRSYIDPTGSGYKDNPSSFTELMAQMAIFSNALAEGRLEDVLEEGLKYYSYQSIVQLLKEEAGTTTPSMFDLFTNMDFEVAKVRLKPALKEKLEKNVPLAILEPIQMAIFSIRDLSQVQDVPWNEILQRYHLDGSAPMIGASIEGLKLGLDMAKSTPAALAKIQQLATSSGQSEKQLTRLAVLACAGSRDLPIEDALAAQITVLFGIPSGAEGGFYSMSFCRMVAERALFLCANQRFLISAPALKVPRIVKLANSKNLTLKNAATLMLAVKDALDIQWHSDTLLRVREVAGQDQ